jgi:hypothetical protein
MNFSVLGEWQNGRQHVRMNVKQSQLKPISEHVAARIVELGIEGILEELKASAGQSDEARLCDALDRLSANRQELEATLKQLELRTASKRKKR